jgi:hypothetical protein
LHQSIVLRSRSRQWPRSPAPAMLRSSSRRACLSISSAMRSRIASPSAASLAWIGHRHRAEEDHHAIWVKLKRAWCSE